MIKKKYSLIKLIRAESFKEKSPFLSIIKLEILKKSSNVKYILIFYNISVYIILLFHYFIIIINIFIFFRGGGDVYVVVEECEIGILE